MTRYFETVGIQLDQLLCAVIFGIRGMTISLHAALEAKAGRRWACWLCAFLSWAVQRNHCANQLAGAPMTVGSYALASFWLGFLSWALWEILAVLFWHVPHLIIIHYGPAIWR